METEILYMLKLGEVNEVDEFNFSGNTITNMDKVKWHERGD